MKPSHAVLAVAALTVVGCQYSPAPVVPAPVAARPVAPATPVTKAPTPPPVAIVEPYLVAVDVTPPAPVPLGGRIMGGPITPLPEPIAPVLPTQTVPIVPKTTPSVPIRPAPATPKKTTIPPAVVRLLEDERARSVDDARQRLTAATTRAAQTAAEAKKQWGYVKEGFVAQKQAENADAAARDAASEQADAQKAFDAAQQRQRDARRDLKSAYSAVAEISLQAVALGRPLPAYRPMPYTYRLSVLGDPPGSIAVENGTLGRSLTHTHGEGGAWIVRCADPTRLHVKIGTSESAVVVHALPVAEAPARSAT